MALNTRLRWAEVLFPLPFLLVAAGMNLGLWQQDADFLRGDVQEIEAVMVDAGPLERKTSRPRFRPTFQPVAGGTPFRLEEPLVASELPRLGEPVVLLCSRHTASRCRVPAGELRWQHYVFAGLWTLLSLTTAAVLWLPTRRERRRRAG